MLVLIIAEDWLLQELFYCGAAYNRIIPAMFYFYFGVIKIQVACKILEPTSCTNKLLKKNSANGEASPQGYL